MKTIFLIILSTLIVPRILYGGCNAAFIFQETGPLKVQFYNQSEIFDEGISYQHWDFGDGSTSYDEHPLHIYSNPGKYLIRLTVFSGNMCFDYIEREILVGIPSSSPYCILNIYFATQNATAPNYNNGMATVYAYSDVPCCYWAYWSNGMEGPTVNNLLPGTYCVTLTNGYDCFGTDCVTIGYNNNCSSDFEIDSISLNYIPGLYRFINNSHGEAEFYYWDFGDGNYSFATNPLHIFREPGNYEVCLTINTNYNCSNTFCKTIIVNEAIPDIASLYGKLYAGTHLLPVGIAILYERVNSSFKAIQTSFINEGNYSFNNLSRGKQYLTQLIPYFDIDTLYFPKYVPVYQDNSVYWQDADFINLFIDTVYHSSLYSYNDISFNMGKINGYVTYIDTSSYEENIFLQNWFFNDIFEQGKAANLIVLLKNTNKEILDFRLTNGAGFFSFKNLPFGTYYLSVEKPGLISDEVLVTITKENSEANTQFALNSDRIINVDDTKFNGKIMSIFPNPASDKIYFESFFNGDLYKIINFNGEIVKSGKLYYGINEIVVSDIPSGMYIFQIVSDQQSYCRKLFKH